MGRSLLRGTQFASRHLVGSFPRIVIETLQYFFSRPILSGTNFCLEKPLCRRLHCVKTSLIFGVTDALTTISREGSLGCHTIGSQGRYLPLPQAYSTSLGRTTGPWYAGVAYFCQQFFQRGSVSLDVHVAQNIPGRMPFFFLAITSSRRVIVHRGIG